MTVAESIEYYPVECLNMTLLYGVTNFEWLQNQEAVKILLNKVWPKLKEIYSSKVKVWIVGRKMPDWIIKRSQDDSDIIVTENIDDARKAYSSATVMITPIEGGGGTRIKILEAMAAGLPVISTSTGITGLNVTDGKNVFIADDPSEMAKKAKRLLEDKGLALKMGKNAREHVLKNFDYRHTAKKMIDITKEKLGLD